MTNDLSIFRDREIVQEDHWFSLKQFTGARIALGRAGVSIPLKETLNFKLAHAHARDAVVANLDIPALMKGVEDLKLEAVCCHSQASSREMYLQRPDLGRRLNHQSLQNFKPGQEAHDVVVILADGLSATAVNLHAVAVLDLLMNHLRQRYLKIAPVFIVEQGRVAISDEIGLLNRAQVAVILIGERPGLSSPDSLGAYLTYNPTPGLTDDSRNCVSNIRPEGLTYLDAAKKIGWLIEECLKRKLSGVLLKDTLEIDVRPPLQSIRSASE